MASKRRREKYFGKSAKLVTPAGGRGAGRIDEGRRPSSRRTTTRGPPTTRAAQVITAMARAGPHHRGDGQARPRAARPRSSTKRASGSINYAADYVMDMLDDTVGAIDEDIVVTTTLDRQYAGGRRARADRRAQRQGRQISASRRARSSRSTPTAPSSALVGGRDYADSQFDRASRRQAPARLRLQAVRLSQRARKGPDARHRARRRADHRQGLEPGKLFQGIFRAGDADQGAVAFAQHGRRAPRPGSRPQDGGAHRPSSRHRVRPRAERLDRARHVRGDAARTGVGLRRFRQWRHRRAAARHLQRPHRQRQAALLAQERQLRPGDRPAICRDDERR